MYTVHVRQSSESGKGAFAEPNLSRCQGLKADGCRRANHVCQLLEGMAPKTDGFPLYASEKLEAVIDHLVLV